MDDFEDNWYCMCTLQTRKSFSIVKVKIYEQWILIIFKYKRYSYLSWNDSTPPEFWWYHIIEKCINSSSLWLLIVGIRKFLSTCCRYGSARWLENFLLSADFCHFLSSFLDFYIFWYWHHQDYNDVIKNTEINFFLH